MDTLQKIRSRKIIHNVSIRYKHRIARKILIARKEMIDTKLLKKSNVACNSEVSSSTSRCTRQKCQHMEFLYGSSPNSCNSIAESEKEDQYDDIEDSSILGEGNFEKQLASVFLKTRINHVQAKEILKLLRTHSCFSQIHLDPRTVMRTPRTPCHIDDVAGGQYLHIGFEKGIKSILQNTPFNMIPDNLEIDFHIDGASLDSANRIQLYPIQIRIANIHGSKPEIVGVWKGSSKPTNPTEFLNPFVDDVLNVKKNGGISFHGKQITFNIRCFIADAVARAFVLGHQSHKSKVPCSKCWVVGESVRQGVIVYCGVDHKLRTKEEYDIYLDGEHHKEGTSSISRLSMDLVKQTVFDYMHLVCLGIMEKICLAVIDGKYASSAKLSPASIRILSSRLELAKQFCPREFARKPINITKHRSFKATEYRQILLYTGPVIFLELLNEAMYLHFLLLHSAMRILVDTVSCRDVVLIDKAEMMLKIFVKRAPELYGVEFVSFNVHGLLHLSNDVRNYGSLDSFSAFPYENNMSYFKRICRKPNHHLQQINNRRSEEETFYNHYIVPSTNVIKVSGMHKNGPIPETGTRYYSQYRNIFCKEFFLSLNGKDDTVILQNRSICIIQNIIKTGNEYQFVVKCFQTVDNFFRTLVESSQVGMFHCSKLGDELIVISFDEVIAKCFKFPLHGISQNLHSSDYVVATMLSCFN